MSSDFDESCTNREQGPLVNDVYTVFGVFDPLPLVCILARFIVLESRNLPYYVCIWVTPSPSQSRRHLSMAPEDNSFDVELRCRRRELDNSNMIATYFKSLSFKDNQLLSQIYLFFVLVQLSSNSEGSISCCLILPFRGQSTYPHE